MSKRKQGWVSEPAGHTPFHNPFADLVNRAEATAEAGPGQESQASPALQGVRLSPEPLPVHWSGMALRLWHERKGRAGKTVTMVGAFGSVAEAQAVAALLSRSLGCGAQVDGERVVLQGDQRQRASAVLAKQGVGRLAR